jgi:hypothetical protein
VTQVFISYRHTSPDQELAGFLVSYLESRGLGVFIDSQMHVGTKWVAEIERQIKESNYFVVLLSANSIRSDMVRQEVELAHSLPGVTILPIRVAFDGALPYDFAAYLNPIQYAFWKSTEDDQSIAEQIFSAINRSAALPHPGQADETEASTASLQKLADVTENAGAPLPAADPRLMFDTGAVKVGSPFYIRRAADDKLANQLQREGQTIIVKGMRQMGKSSLLATAIAAARQHDHKTFYFDLQRLGPEQLDSLDSLLRYFARRVAREFRTALKPDEVWDNTLSAKDNLTYFIEDVVLADAQTPVLFFFDEADQVFGYPYRDQFFSLIRAWHNDRAINERWARLHLVIAHSTEPFLWIQDINQSPFNVGFPIRLEDFDETQIAELNDKHGRPLKTAAEIQGLMELLGGQPYLVRQALYVLFDSKLTLAQLQTAAADESGPFGDHLRRHTWALQKDKRLKAAIRQILLGNGCDDELDFQRLRAAGLIRGETRRTAQIRCQLYAEYFKNH